MDHLITEALRDLLTGQCTPAVVRAIESEAAASAGASAAAAALWQQIEDSGFAEPKKYRPRNIPAAGSAIKDADKGIEQMSFI